MPDIEQPAPRRRGRPPGKREAPRADSLQHRLSALEVGAVDWVETTPDRYGQIMRAATLPDARRTASMQGRRFTCTLFRAFPVAGSVESPGAVLVRVQRIE